jgi:rhodanese-related sulfurtransferase
MREISAKVLKEMIDKDVDFVLIDARAHESYDIEHLPGALSMPSDHLGEHVLADYKKERTIVTYCTGWSCGASSVAAQKLEKFGFKKVLLFKGGLEDWKKAGYATQK